MRFLLPALLAGLAAFLLGSCTTTDSVPLRTNAGVTIYSPPGDLLDQRPAAPC